MNIVPTMASAAADDGYNSFLSYLSDGADRNDVKHGPLNGKVVIQVNDPTEEDADATVPNRLNGHSPSTAAAVSRRKLSRRASTTEERRNPFAEREGNALIWTGVNMTLSTKSGERKLLKDVWGEVPPGEITAIMGPRYANTS